MSESSADLAAKRPVLELRSRVLSSVRRFFSERGYLEVDTPVRVSVPAMEQHIDAEPAGDAWLRTSPELHLKRLVCAGLEQVYQIGPCFRQGERGQRHLPEYTMLEWYRTGITSTELIQETAELLQFVADDAIGKREFLFRGLDVNLDEAPDVHTVRDLFWLHAGWDPVEEFDGDRFDVDLVEKVEPMLSGPSPTIVKDFPAALSALAQRHEQNPALGDRWEMYLGGMELANAYTELRDPEEQRQRFEEWGHYREEHGHPVYQLDESFLAALENPGLPPCAGIALGIDRLMMVLAECDNIRDVVAFAE